MTQPYADKWVSECGTVVLYRGDCLEVVASLESNAVDVVIADPPYSSGGHQETSKAGGSLTGRHKARGEAIAYDNLSTRGYLRLMSRVLRATDADEFYVFTDWRMWMNTYDAMEDAAIRVRNMIVWDKMAMGMGAGWRSQHELIAHGKRSTSVRRGGSCGNVIQCKRSGNVNHSTEKPIGLMSRLVSASDDAATILDPFMGSGTTGVACAETGRKFIGVEIDLGYFEVAKRRISAALADRASQLIPA